jgi:hypothetical protein
MNRLPDDPCGMGLWCAAELLGDLALNESSGTAQGNHFLFLGACAVFMLAGIMVLAWLGTPPVNPAVGKSLPELELAPLLNADSKGSAEDSSQSLKVFYLWGPWDSESRIGYQRIADLYQRFQSNSRIQFVLVAFSEGDTDVDQLRAESQAAMEEAGFQLPCFYDPTGESSMELALLMPYGSMGFPTTLVADSSGKVVHLIEGSSSDEFVKLEQILVEYSRSLE